MNKLLGFVMIVIGVIGILSAIFYTFNALLAYVFTGENSFIILAIFLPLIFVPSCVYLIRLGLKILE